MIKKFALISIIFTGLVTVGAIAITSHNTTHVTYNSKDDRLHGI